MKIVLMALMDGILGWLSVHIFIKLLFRPLEPKKIPLTPFVLQGFIPKKRSQIAGFIGNAIEKQVSLEDLINEWVTEENKKEILYSIKSKIMDVLDDKMPSLLPKFLRHLILNKVAQVLNKELSIFFDNAIKDLTGKVTDKFNLSRLIEDKINEFDLNKLEEYVFNTGKRRLIQIRLFGGVFGLFVGIVQGLMFNLLELVSLARNK